MRLPPLIAGNWKMNGLRAALAEIDTLQEKITATPPLCDIVICPPATLLNEMAARFSKSAMAFGGQDCHSADTGAHTGDISASMLADAGAQYVIIGHSERRTDHGERNADIAAKASAAHKAGLKTIICIGETLAQREEGITLDITAAQLAGSLGESCTADNIIIAYEPVWAIGTGLTPSRTQIATVHAAIREKLIEFFGDAGANIHSLYGGSVKPNNAAEILNIPHVTGALVGGASLKAQDLYGIISACESKD